MHSLRDISLIVPTFQRQPFLRRLAYFYSAYPVSLIIVDGTDGSAWSEASNLSTNIHYIHRPGEPIHDRISLALNKVNTPYAAWLGDDEFQLPSGLIRSAEILNADSTVNTVMGSCMGFNAAEHGIFGGPVYGYRSKKYSNSLSRRIEDFFLHYSPTVAYALWRSDQLVEASALVSARSWGSGNLGEWIQAFCGLCQGNHVIHDHLQWLRSDENPPQQAQLKRSVSVSQWASDARFAQERYELLLLLETFLKTSLGCGSEFAQALISYAINTMVFGENRSRELQLLGLKPVKNYRRDYATPLAQILTKHKHDQDVEASRVLQAISMVYQ